MKYRAQYSYDPESVVQALRQGLGYDVEDGKAKSRDWKGEAQRAAVHPHTEAAQRVEAAFKTLNVPGEVHVEYIDSRRREGALDDGEIHAVDNDFDVDVRIAGYLGTVYVRVPVAKRAGRYLSPSTMYVKGQPFLVTQAAIDQIFGQQDPNRYQPKT